MEVVGVEKFLQA
jgi:hypothetical protein